MRSPSLTIPITRPRSSTTGAALMWCLRSNRAISRTLVSGPPKSPSSSLHLYFHTVTTGKVPPIRCPCDRPCLVDGGRGTLWVTRRRLADQARTCVMVVIASCYPFVCAFLRFASLLSGRHRWRSASPAIRLMMSDISLSLLLHAFCLLRHLASPCLSSSLSICLDMIAHDSPHLAVALHFRRHFITRTGRALRRPSFRACPVPEPRVRCEGCQCQRKRDCNCYDTFHVVLLFGF